MQKVYKTMVFEIILQKGIEKISPFLNCPILQNTISLQKLFALLENVKFSQSFFK